MTSLTRRQLLAGTSMGLALFAGCSDTETRPPEVSDQIEKEVEADFVRVRSASEPTLFWRGNQQDSEENPQRQRTGGQYLATDSDLEAVEFASTADGDELGSFVNATNFENESIFLFSTGVSECHEIQLQQTTVEKGTGDPHLDFCRSVRPADVACSKEVTHTVAYAVRFPIDGRGVTGHGTGMSSQCRDPAVHSIFNVTVTVEQEGSE